MGLDIYFYKRIGKNEFSPAKVEKINDVMDIINEEEVTEKAEKINDVIDIIDEELETATGTFKDELEVAKGTLIDLKDNEALELELDETAGVLMDLRACYDEDISNDTDEVAYFRKVNLLMKFFNYTGNCDYKEISKEQIEDLLNKCELVLSNNANPEETLPNTDGFCFGSTDYDDYYLSEVKEVKEKFTEILEDTDFEKERIEMLAWW